MRTSTVAVLIFLYTWHVFHSVWPALLFTMIVSGLYIWLCSIKAR